MSRGARDSGLGTRDGGRIPNPESRIPALYLGIDGGQTGTQAVLADATGRVRGRGAGGPSNHVEMPGGRERLRGAVIDSTNAALREAGLGDVTTVTFATVYCAMTGEADFKTEIITPIFKASTVCVEHDAPAALAGATLGMPGIIVVAGHGVGGLRGECPGRDVAHGRVGLRVRRRGKWLRPRARRRACSPRCAGRRRARDQPRAGAHGEVRRRRTSA